MPDFRAGAEPPAGAGHSLRVEPYLLLAIAEGCGESLVAPLLDPALDPQAVLAGTIPLPPRAQRAVLDPDLRPRAGAVIAQARQHGCRILTPADAVYPQRLRPVPLRPLVLFARGDVALLEQRPAIAIVGSRTPTPYGIAAAHDFAGALAGAGILIWSGLALGIDGIAHEQALAGGRPTVAVLAGGLAQIHPRSHAPLAVRIENQAGLLLSEAPPEQPARRGHFPRRNRILAAMADAVLVVEAGLTSGTLHTARFAAESGVPVFAVPGPYTSVRSRGCHDLIAEGAQIARDPEELIRRLGAEPAVAKHAATLTQSGDETAILRALREGPRPYDLVQREVRLSDGQFLQALFALEQAGRVRRLAGDLLALG